MLPAEHSMMLTRFLAESTTGIQKQNWRRIPADAERGQGQKTCQIKGGPGPQESPSTPDRRGIWGKGARQLPPANLSAPNRGSEPTRIRQGATRARALDENVLLSLCNGVGGEGGVQGREIGGGGPTDPRRSSRSPCS